MVIHFCPRCGRINLADFLFCPYCGVSISPGPSLNEAIERPFASMEKLAKGHGRKDGAAELESLEARLSALESDIEEILAAKGGQ